MLTNTEADSLREKRKRAPSTSDVIAGPSGGKAIPKRPRVELRMSAALESDNRKNTSPLPVAGKRQEQHAIVTTTAMHAAARTNLSTSTAPAASHKSVTSSTMSICPHSNNSVPNPQWFLETGRPPIPDAKSVPIRRITYPNGRVWAIRPTHPLNKVSEFRNTARTPSQ